MKFNTSPIKEIKFYNRPEYETVEWGFFGSDDYIRLINVEQNIQGTVYGVQHDTLNDMKIDLKNNILTCLCTYKNEMTYSGVKLPQLEENAQDDMEVDQVPTSNMQVDDYLMPDDKEYFFNDEINQPESLTINDKEETKNKFNYADRAAIRTNTMEKSNSQYNAHAVPPAKGDDVDRSNYDANDNLSMTTFKPNPDSTPAGIDFDEFGGNYRGQEYEDIDKV